MAPKSHTPLPTDLAEAEWAELREIITDASQRLCAAVGTTYAGQETVGFNQGAEAGQAVGHAHVHILPVSNEDPTALKKRGGIGGAFEALRRERLSDTD